MRDVDRGWNGTTLPGPGHRSVGADDSCRRGLDGEWKMDWTDLVRRVQVVVRWRNGDEVHLAGEYDYVNVTLRQVAVSGNFTTIWFCAALLSVLVRCRMRVRKRRDLRPVVDAEIRLLRKEIQIGIGHRNQSK